MSDRKGWCRTTWFLRRRRRTWFTFHDLGDSCFARGLTVIKASIYVDAVPHDDYPRPPRPLVKEGTMPGVVAKRKDRIVTISLTEEQRRLLRSIVDLSKRRVQELPELNLNQEQYIADLGRVYEKLGGPDVLAD